MQKLYAYLFIPCALNNVHVGDLLTLCNKNIYAQWFLDKAPAGFPGHSIQHSTFTGIYLIVFPRNTNIFSPFLSWDNIYLFESPGQFFLLMCLVRSFVYCFSFVLVLCILGAPVLTTAAMIKSHLIKFRNYAYTSEFVLLNVLPQYIPCFNTLWV